MHLALSFNVLDSSILIAWKHSDFYGEVVSCQTPCLTKKLVAESSLFTMCFFGFVYYVFFFQICHVSVCRILSYSC